jgi:hypothetical protein
MQRAGNIASSKMKADDKGGCHQQQKTGQKPENHCTREDGFASFQEGEQQSPNANQCTTDPDQGETRGIATGEGQDKREEEDGKTGDAVDDGKEDDRKFIFYWEEASNDYGEEAADGEDEVDDAQAYEMLPDKPEREAERNDGRDDDNDGALQHIETQDDEKKHGYEQNAKGDGVGDQGERSSSIDADCNLPGGQQAGEEQQDAVKDGHFHGQAYEEVKFFHPGQTRYCGSTADSTAGWRRKG